MKNAEIFAVAFASYDVVTVRLTWLVSVVATVHASAITLASSTNMALYKPMALNRALFDWL